MAVSELVKTRRLLQDSGGSWDVVKIVNASHAVKKPFFGLLAAHRYNEAERAAASWLAPVAGPRRRPARAPRNPDKDITMPYRLSLILVASLLPSAALKPEADQSPEISADRIKAAVEYLASDRLEGRGPGTRGEFLATEYLAAEFKKAGLKPIGQRGTYFQPVPLVRVATSPKSTLRAVKDTTTLDIPCEEGFSGTSQTQKELEEFDAEAIFLGHGITAPEFGWDDYKDVDVKGKVVVLFTNLLSLGSFLDGAGGRAGIFRVGGHEDQGEAEGLREEGDAGAQRQGWIKYQNRRADPRATSMWCLTVCKVSGGMVLLLGTAPQVTMRRRRAYEKAIGTLHSRGFRNMSWSANFSRYPRPRQRRNRPGGARNAVGNY